MDSSVKTVITKSKRPNKTIICAKIACVPFKDLLIKDLFCPTLTYFYNMEMNQANRKD